MEQTEKTPEVSGKRLASSERGRQIEKACVELESLFIYHLLKEMRATIPASGLINRSGAEEVYASMLDSQVARELSERGGIGLSSLVLTEFGRENEIAKKKE
ncbi:MAG: rod-binding protein [Deltaproteobacteria bacterium]|nr:rod-binding protein [Deltaproteobacteria bacterium]